ncbi:MAG: flavodoxin domain-containing protein [Chitinophagales bacterium]
MSTLIAYSTKHGATRKYAEALAGEFSGPVRVVDLRQDPGVDLAPFDTVIIGSAIYAGQAQKEVRDFCARNLAALKEKRLGLYVCCWFQDQAPRQLAAAFPSELLAAAAAKTALGGEIIMTELTFFERLIVKAVARLKESVSSYSLEAARQFAGALKSA